MHEGVIDLISCPRCRGEMTLAGDSMQCGCGFSFTRSDGFVFFRDEVNHTEKHSDLADLYNAEYYESAFYDYTDSRLETLITLAKPSKGRRILDLGCGPGEVAVRCAKLGAEVFGVDIARDALMLSGRRCTKEGVRVWLFEFDGERVPFRDSTFDTIILSDVVEHIYDDTLDKLVAECYRLLTPKGRLVVHTAPTKNIILLSKVIKVASFGRVDFHARLITPEYEHLHVRYHSMGSLRRFLEEDSLNCVMWGEFRYLRGSILEKLSRKLGLGNLLSDQLWCVASKERLEVKMKDKPYLGFLELPSSLDLGKCSDLCINYGFYASEEERFRWTGRSASVFITVPEHYDRLEVELLTSNPCVDHSPVGVSAYLASHLLGRFSLSDKDLHKYQFKIPEKVRPGIAEFRIEVNTTFVPKDCGINQDCRELGLEVFRVEIA